MISNRGANAPSEASCEAGAMRSATHLPSTCKHWQVIVVAPARGGFVFISWRGGPYPLVLQPQFTRSTLGGPPRRRATKLNSFQSPVCGSFCIHARLQTELPTPRCLRPSLGGYPPAVRLPRSGRYAWCLRQRGVDNSVHKFAFFWRVGRTLRGG